MQRSVRLVSAVLSLVLALLALIACGRTAHAEGALRARRANGSDAGLFPLVRTDVRAEISGQVTGVTVAQRYHNAFAERIEAVYVFPLPVGAAVDEMEMRIGSRVVRALVRTRDEARRAYEHARETGQRAALLEQERPNVFTFAVANIDPGSEVEVRLHYFELARYDHGAYEMVFPMVVGPRYIPGTPLASPPTGSGTQPDTDRVRDGSRISPAYVPPGTRSGHAISLAVHLAAGSEIAAVESPAHEIVVTRPGPATADVALRDKDEIPNRDFVLRWRLAAPELRASVLAHRPDTHADGYLTLLLEPRHDAPLAEIAPREIVFLLDTSGSMQGAPLDTARAAIDRALRSLGPSDTFQLIDFADDASTFAPRPLANTPANVQRAREYLAHLVASGGTNQLAGIHAALATPRDPARVRYVVFMTDGYIGNESEVIALVQREIGAARIFGFGIGSSVNRYLLDEVAAAGRGVAEYLRPHEDARELVERFYTRIARPYLTDVSVDWGGLAVQDVYPRALPDLSALEPLTVLARYHGPGSGTVTVRGRVAGRDFARTIAVTLPAAESANAAVSRVWARAKIEALSRESHRQGETEALVASITDVALSHHLVSRYTSLVAVDEVLPSAAGVPGPARLRVVQPLDAPQGVDLASAGGEIVGGVSGFGGLGATGTGVGGSGMGSATIGLGRASVSVTRGVFGVGHGYGAGVGRGLRGREAAGPVVRAQSPSVTGTLAPQAVRRVVLRNLGQITHCYEQSLARSPSLSGRLVLRFVIDATGRVSATSVAAGTTLQDPAVQACVRTAAQRWLFPQPAGGTVAIIYPFVFTPPETSAPTAPRASRPASRRDAR